MREKFTPIPTKISLRRWPRTMLPKLRITWSVSSAVCPSKEGMWTLNAWILRMVLFGGALMAFNMTLIMRGAS